jgi:hypothetical protein
LRERKMQVVLMRHIYSRAKIVSICLKTAASKRPKVLGQTMKLYAATPDTYQGFEPPIYDVSSPFWSLLAEFFDNPWFSRIWAIQRNW